MNPLELPTGTVTFLFTDIEGSTQLLHRLKDKYAILLADHHCILREAFTQWDGHEVDTQGDAFFVAFGRATQAVVKLAADILVLIFFVYLVSKYFVPLSIVPLAVPW